MLYSSIRECIQLTKGTNHRTNEPTNEALVSQSVIFDGIIRTGTDVCIINFAKLFLTDSITQVHIYLFLKLGREPKIIQRKLKYCIFFEIIVIKYHILRDVKD